MRLIITLCLITYSLGAAFAQESLVQYDYISYQNSPNDDVSTVMPYQCIVSYNADNNGGIIWFDSKGNVWKSFVKDSDYSEYHEGQKQMFYTLFCSCSDGLEYTLSFPEDKQVLIITRDDTEETTILSHKK